MSYMFGNLVQSIYGMSSENEIGLMIFKDNPTSFPNFIKNDFITPE